MLVAGAVVAHGGVGHGLLALREGDRHGIRPVGARGDGVVGHPGGGLEGGQRPAGVAAGEPHEVVAGVVVERVRAVEPARVGRRPRRSTSATSSSVSGSRVISIERREQRRDDRERRVLGGGGDQHDLAVLDPGQQGVLLGLGEAVDLVEEEHGLPAVHVAGPVGVLHDGAHVLDAGGHRRQLDELAVGGGGDEVGEGGLAGARRAPEDGRDRAGRSPAALDQPAQRAAGAQHVALAAHLVDAPRPHPHRERGQRRRRRPAVTGRRGRAEQVGVVEAHAGEAIPQDDVPDAAPCLHRERGWSRRPDAIFTHVRKGGGQ